MARQLIIRGIWIFVSNTACAHACRYCSTGRKRHDAIPFSRLAGVVERFAAWRETNGRPDFGIEFGIGHCYDYDVKTLGQLFALRDRISGRRTDRSLSLGGLRLRSVPEMRDWLQERRDDAGVDRIHASLAGYGAGHDRWNGRVGDFDFLMRTMQSGAELGLRLTQRLFVVNSTLPTLDTLAAALDRLDGCSDRQYSLFYYRGLAARLEDERITEEIRPRLPDDVRDRAQIREWRSEREWLDLICEDEEPPCEAPLKLFLTEENIGRVEALSCDDVIASLAARSREAYQALPSYRTLATGYADAANTRLYSDRIDVESKWLDRYLAKNPVSFERSLTHLWRDF